ncbi:hypothetical protein DFJ74DRAFT_760303 [Hyaloraphidium curvatum]|nr:hypothetical protein DFJ74DRAFT_760303 [Hyaloraphidium curvatum]
MVPPFHSPHSHSNGGAMKQKQRGRPREYETLAHVRPGVRVARHTPTGEIRCVRSFPKPPPGSCAAAVDAARREAEGAARLLRDDAAGHPGVPAFKDFKETDRGWHLVTEHVNGPVGTAGGRLHEHADAFLFPLPSFPSPAPSPVQDLPALLAAHRGPPPEPFAAALVAAILRSLAFLLAKGHALPPLHPHAIALRSPHDPSSAVLVGIACPASPAPCARRASTGGPDAPAHDSAFLPPANLPPARSAVLLAARLAYYLLTSQPPLPIAHPPFPKGPTPEARAFVRFLLHPDPPSLGEALAHPWLAPFGASDEGTAVEFDARRGLRPASAEPAPGWDDSACDLSADAMREMPAAPSPTVGAWRGDEAPELPGLMAFLRVRLHSAS